MFLQRAFIFLALPLLLAACMQAKEPNPSLVRLAVMATLESRPTPEPLVIVVTSVATIVPQPIANVPSVDNLPVNKPAVSKPAVDKLLVNANADATEGGAVPPKQVAQAIEPTPTPSAPTPSAPTPSAPTGAVPLEAEPTGVAPTALPTLALQPSKQQQTVAAVTKPLSEAADKLALTDLSVPTQAYTCPDMSDNSYDLIDMEQADTSHPDYLHGDLNIDLRQPTNVDEPLGLVDYDGATDSNAPKLNGLFVDNRTPKFVSAHQVHDWDWACGTDGCASALSKQFDVALLGMATSPGEAIRIPKGEQEIYGGSYVAAVLYADQDQITIAYTRDGTVANGYAAHITNICVDPNLLASYRKGNNEGRAKLPLLRNDQPIGTSAGSEIRVAIRDRGKFMDPRSKKDWWK